MLRHGGSFLSNGVTRTCGGRMMHCWGLRSMGLLRDLHGPFLPRQVMRLQPAAAFAASVPQGRGGGGGTVGVGAASSAVPAVSDVKASQLLEYLEGRSLLQQVSERHHFQAFLEAWEEVSGRDADALVPSVYLGVDPTAPSLHLGNLIPFRGLQHFQAIGFRPIVLLGGATGLIGDPSGRSTERPLLEKQRVEDNLRGIRECAEALLDFDSSSPNHALLVNNRDWYQEMSVVDFLRDVGKRFRINGMINRKVVRSRLQGLSRPAPGDLEDGEEEEEEEEAGDGAASAASEGMSFAEFSYQLLQAYDFFHLHQRHNCVLQLGGSDQWGNMTAGVQYIHQRLGSGHAAGTAAPPSAAAASSSGVVAPPSSSSSASGDGDLRAALRRHWPRSGSSATTGGSGFRDDKGRAQAFVLTFPILTNKDGEKIGKSTLRQREEPTPTSTSSPSSQPSSSSSSSASSQPSSPTSAAAPAVPPAVAAAAASGGMACWLHRRETAPFELYQELLNRSDDEALQLLLPLTSLPEATLSAIRSEMACNPESRIAQRHLAAEVVKLVHGPDQAEAALLATTLLFGDAGSDISSLADADVDALYHLEGLPTVDISEEECQRSLAFPQLLRRLGFVSSNREGERVINGGGAYVNDCRIDSPKVRWGPSHVLGGNHRISVIRCGRKRSAIIRVS